MTLTTAYEIIGFIGGCMFPISTGFQTIKVIRTKSARDISYGWQAIFTVAHALYLVYSLHFGIWVLYIPQLIEIVLMFVMIVAKFYFDYIRPKRIKDKAGIDGTPT